MSSALKKTFLYSIHTVNNAKMADFAGWYMPIEYQGILKEAKAARASCVLFDISHMGEIIIAGSKSLKFIQHLTSNDASTLPFLQLNYNLFINPSGGIIDDFMLYHLGDKFLCVVNASNKNKVLSWLNHNKTNDVEVIDDSDKTALLSLQGPYAKNILGEILNDSLDNLKYMHFIQTKIRDINCLISRSGYTGEDGFELFFDYRKASYLWQLITTVGGKFSLSFAGLGARDVLRTEAGYPLYGHEINDTINPLEASLGWVVKEKKKDFIGKEKILAIRNKGISKKRIGFVMKDKGMARKGYYIFNNDKNICGMVTSGVYSPNINKFIGMGYAAIESAQPKNTIFIEIRGKLYQASIEKYPFVEIRTKL